MKKLILLLIMGIVLVNLSNLILAEEKCKNIYCNDFNYICCGTTALNPERVVSLEQPLNQYTPNTGKQPISCDSGTDIINCKVKIYNSGLVNHRFWISSGDCIETSEYLGITKRWDCSGEQENSLAPKDSVERILQPGQKIYGSSSSSNEIREFYITKKVLMNTGKSTDASAGIKVTGSVGCTFDFSNYDKIYKAGQPDSKGAKTLNVNDCYAVTSFNERRVCGNTCDGCMADVDCANNYPKQINYNSRNLGATCSGGQMILYGCQGTGQKVCIEKDILPDGSEKCNKEQEKKDCQIVSRITTGIECCSSDDCQGAGDFFCNWISSTSSKCEKKAVCSKDQDCGTANKCDSAKNEVIIPACIGGQCTEKSLKKVECCKDSDCLGGQYCTSDYICKQTPESTSTYDTKSDSKSVQSQKSSGITGNVIGNSGSSKIGIIILVVIILVIGGAIGLYVYNRNKSKGTVVSSVASSNLCTKCGSSLNVGSKFCTKCGNKA
jgi:hypothetical protein